MEKKLEKADLGQFIGTEHYYKYWGITFTDGVKYLVEVGGAFWLLDIIVSYQIYRKIKKIPFQVWTLKVDVEKKTGVVTMKEDTGRPCLVTQKMEFTDFPLDEITMWLIDGVLILPSEY